MKWTPDLIIALVIVVGCLTLIALRIDSDIKGILGIAAGWCFGSQYQVRKMK